MFNKISALVIFTVALASCQKNDADLMQEAQACLNEAPASEARGCVAKISSITTPAAYKLRCSAVYISEGFREASDFITAMDKLKEDGTGCTNCSGTLNAMNALNFSQGNVSDPGATGDAARDRNIAVADEAFNVCTLSQSKGYTQISSLFKLGTQTTMWAYKYTGVVGGTPTPAELEAAVGNMIGDSNAEAGIGQVVITSYETICAGNTDPSESTVEYCEELSESLESGATAQVIGACLLNKIVDKDYICP